jgi:hypothetical protein
LHRETKSSTRIVNLDQFEKVVDRRVDPSSTLRKQYTEGVRDDGLTDGLLAKYVFALRKSLEHERSEVSVLPKKQKILFVQRVDDVFRIMFDDVGIGQNGDPVPRVIALGSLDPIHTEAARQASDSTEQRFERFREMMGNIVLENWNGLANDI